MRIRSVAAAGAAVLLAVSACGSNDTSTGGSGDAQKLTVWIMQGTNPDASTFFDSVKKDFEQQNAGTTLDIQYQPWGEAHDKFTTAIAGGTTPDVSEVGTTWTPEFAAAGALEDLTSRVGSDKDNLVPGLLDAGTVDGKIYGMPWYAGVRSFVYNKDIFTKAGVEPPTTWQGIVDVATKIKASQPDVIPFAVAGECTYCAMPFVWGAGGEVATDSGGKWTAAIDSEKAQKGLDFYTSLATKGFSTPAAQTWKETDLLKAFEDGKTAMVITGNWTLTKIATDAPAMKDKVGAFPIPGETGGIAPSFLGGSHFGMFKTAKNKDLAWKFIQLMSTDKYASQWAQQSNYFPGTKTALDAATKTDDPAIAPFAKQMVDGGKSMPVTPAWGKVEGAKTLTKLIQSIVTGKASVADATKTAASEMNTLFQG